MKTFLPAALSFLLFSCNSGIQTGKNDSTPDSIIQPLNTSSHYSEDNPLSDPENLKGNKLMQAETVGKLHLGFTANRTISEIGNPDFKSAATLWGADNLYHQDWTYDSGIDLNMSGEDSLSMEIFSLRLFSPSSLKTSRNIGIGSTMEEVKAAYKKELLENAGEEQSLVAGSIYGGIIFSFENGKLSSVFIGSAAE